MGDEGRCDVLPGLGTGEDPASRALDTLVLAQGFDEGPEQDTITVIEAGGDKDVGDFINGRVKE